MDRKKAKDLDIIFEKGQKPDLWSDILRSTSRYTIWHNLTPWYTPSAVVHAIIYEDKKVFVP